MALGLDEVKVPGVVGVELERGHEKLEGQVGVGVCCPLLGSYAVVEPL